MTALQRLILTVTFRDRSVAIVSGGGKNVRVVRPGRAIVSDKCLTTMVRSGVLAPAGPRTTWRLTELGERLRRELSVAHRIDAARAAEMLTEGLTLREISVALRPERPWCRGSVRRAVARVSDSAR